MTVSRRESSEGERGPQGGPPGPRKQKSGAQKRRERREREEAARRAVASCVDGADGALPPHLQQYERLGPPPLDPVCTIAWANAAGALLLWETLTDTQIDARERRRVAADLIAKIGMTHSRAHVEATVAKLERKIYGAGQDAASKRQKVITIPKRGTALYEAWQARGEIPTEAPEGVLICEEPPTSRLFKCMEAEEEARKRWAPVGEKE